MNLFFFNPKTANYELVRENVDDLEAEEIKATIIEFFMKVIWTVKQEIF